MQSSEFVHFARDFRTPPYTFMTWYEETEVTYIIGRQTGLYYSSIAQRDDAMKENKKQKPQFEKCLVGVDNASFELVSHVLAELS